MEHTLIWTKVPIYHSDLLDESIKSRVEQDGLWGFTGSDTAPPSPSRLPEALPALSEWGITLETMIVSPRPASDEKPLIERAGREVERFVKNRWDESRWETAWFVNPPVSFPLSSGSGPWSDVNDNAEATERSRSCPYSCLCTAEAWKLDIPVLAPVLLI